jgi:hypothetical protein
VNTPNELEVCQYVTHAVVNAWHNGGFHQYDQGFMLAICTSLLSEFRLSRVSEESRVFALVTVLDL